MKHSLHGAKFLNEALGNLWTYARNPRDVVRLVARETKNLCYLLGIDTESFLDGFHVVGLVLHGIDHQDVIGNKLHHVFVAGDDDRP